MKLLEGKIACVTGGAAGIGEAIALECAEHGAAVAVLDRNGPGAARVADSIRSGGGRTLAIEADVCDPAGLAAGFDGLLREFGGLDILVNNAGAYPRKDFLEMSEADWHAMIAVNLDSVFHCSKLAVPHLIARGGGKIVNISSVTFFLGMARLAHYVAAKGGIVGFTRSLARELGPRGVFVNCITPGAVKTESEKAVVSEEQANAMVELQSLKRRIMPLDIARAALFLASSLSDGITGQTLNVDGGWMMH